MSEQLSILAARLRDVPAFPDLPPVSQPFGFHKRAVDTHFSVQIRLGSVTYTLGETMWSSTAAVFSDCCQHWFSPWLKRNRNKLATFNFGQSTAIGFISRYKQIHELLIDLEIELVGSGRIVARSVKEAGRNANLDLQTIQNLIERVASLERRMSEYDVRRGRPAPREPAPIITFTPPGAMKHPPANYVHHESVNPAIAKSVFKL